MDETNTQSMPDQNPPMPDSSGVANLKAASAPYFAAPATQSHSKYDLAGQDPDIASHFPTVDPLVELTPEPEIAPESKPIQPIQETEPPKTPPLQPEEPIQAPGQEPKKGNGPTLKILLFSGLGVLVLGIVIGGGFWVYSLQKPTEVETTEETVTTTGEAPATEETTPEESTEETKTAEETPTTSTETPTTSPSTQTQTPTTPPEETSTPPVATNTGVNTQNTQNTAPAPTPTPTPKSDNLSETGPSLLSIFANLALAVLIFAFGKITFEKFAHIKVKKKD